MVFKSIVTSMCICLTVVSFNANASATFYDTRAEFLESVSGNNTDDYSTYVPGIYTDIDMSAVFGEASYEALTFPNQNQVGFVFRENFESYCSGCNGNFKLGFQSTSFSENGGVFGVGIDIILHTSRRVSIGDDNPANPTFEGSVQIQFADGSTEQILIPADIGYYEPSIYFLGITDERGIASITIGTEPTASRHFWIIDNLTVGAALVTTTSVSIDIKPSSESNSINISSAGIIPVAILSTADFDAITVDPTSVSLAGASVRMVGKSGKYLCHQEDINLDGFIDLICQIYTAQFFVEEGETTAILEAETFDGTKLRGEDVIRIVPDN